MELSLRKENCSKYSEMDGKTSAISSVGRYFRCDPELDPSLGTAPCPVVSAAASSPSPALCRRSLRPLPRLGAAADAAVSTGPRVSFKQHLLAW